MDKQLEQDIKSFDQYFIQNPHKRVGINHDNSPERIEALKWFMSYDDVEKGQLIRLLYEQWQENQQVVLQQMSGER
jgi:hypothetical protein